jgi:nucleotide-binding universal stress UspA family protein
MGAGASEDKEQSVDALTVLVAVDFSECCRLALRRAMSLLAQPLGRVVVLHVIDNDFVEHYLRQQRGDRDQVQKELFLRAKSDLREFLQEERLSAQDVKAVVCQGVPFLEINKKAVELDADVVVLGTCGKTGDMNSIFFGGTAEKVLRFISRPVLCVPPEMDYRQS